MTLSMHNKPQGVSERFKGDKKLTSFVIQDVGSLEALFDMLLLDEDACGISARVSHACPVGSHSGLHSQLEAIKSSTSITITQVGNGIQGLLFDINLRPAGQNKTNRLKKKKKKNFIHIQSTERPS